MCLAIPARIVSVQENDGWRSAVATVDGVERAVDLTLTPEATVGDFIVTHAGFAISMLPPDRAVETMKMLGLDPE